MLAAIPPALGSRNVCATQRRRSYTFTAPATLGANGLQVLLSLKANVTNARIYIGFDKHVQSSSANGDEQK